MSAQEALQGSETEKISVFSKDIFLINEENYINVLVA